MGEAPLQVFLSYNRADADFVRAVAARLHHEGIRFWFDEANLRPGELWQRAIQRDLPRCAACAVFLGPSGLGPWHELEIHAALSQQIGANRGFRVIPVLLPGASRDQAQNVPLFLQQLMWVEFQGTPDQDATAWHRLRCGIEGKDPGFLPPPPAYLTAADPQTKIVPRGLRSFDAEDHAWYLRLVPGPRDRGLPSAIRFWKDRLESIDPDDTFKVGLLYGPSGCGKSSLIKAGLIPALAGFVLPIYVEATAQDTENTLLRKLRKALPLLPADLSLSQTLAALRQQPALAGGRKVVLLLDQFEQWLHAHAANLAGELTDALRHCDGGRLQAVVMLRDDFQTASHRFFKALSVGLSDTKNLCLVDLFDRTHARSVLIEYGRAFEKPPNAEQEEFLTQVIHSLEKQDGRVACVHLALLAELLRDHEWTPASLGKLGGPEQVGLHFFKKKFDVPPVNPAYHVQRGAARALLKAMLPEAGTDIRDQRCSRRFLAQAAGLDETSPEFASLLDILDGELKVITPTEVPAGAAAAEKPYQLTHDYLVPSLRQWLAEGKTARDRAQLRLEERAKQYRATPSFRFLPGPLEFLRILWLAPRANRCAAEQALMRAAGRFYTAALGVATLLAVAAFLIAGRVQQEKARALVQSLGGRTSPGLPAAIENLRPVARHARPLLRDEFVRAAADSQSRLNAAVALAAFGELAPLQQLTQRSSDPTNRTAFIHGFRQWPSDPVGLAKVLQSVAASTDTNTVLADFRSALCAAFALVEWQALAPSDQAGLPKLMQQLYTNAPDGGTHGAAACALNRWGQQPLPAIAPSTNPPAPGQDWFVNRAGMTMIRIPTGKFVMGDAQDTDAKPHPVTLTRPFFISDREVTVALFRQFASDTTLPPAERLGEWTGEDPKYSPTTNGPVQQVSWFDAVKFCNWLSYLSYREGLTNCYTPVTNAAGELDWQCHPERHGYRLPTEAEWEYACRAVSASAFAFGDDENLLGEYAWYTRNSLFRTWPAGTKLPNLWGLFDLHGNVGEWCQDWYDSDYYQVRLPTDPSTDPPGPPTGRFRVLRGGSWLDIPASLRCGRRRDDTPGHRGIRLGFRCVLVGGSSP